MDFNYNDDIIDSRALYLRKDELEMMKSAVDAAQEEYEDAQGELALMNPEDESIDEARERVATALQDLKDAQDEFSLPEQQELDMLTNLENEIDDFMHGVSLIADDYFETYAQEYAHDVCEMPGRGSLRWPFTCIDWKQAAEELKSDFSSVEIEGNTYYFN